jgi:DNA invertase Pin-like site-specific DNA recombinase
LFRVKPLEKQLQHTKNLRSKNKTWEQIADEIGVDRVTLYKHKLPQQFKPLRGQLTEEKKAEAKKLRLSGKTWKQIAALLEVSLSSIYMSGTHKQ